MFFYDSHDSSKRRQFFVIMCSCNEKKKKKKRKILQAKIYRQRCTSWMWSKTNFSRRFFASWIINYEPYFRIIPNQLSFQTPYTEFLFFLIEGPFLLRVSCNKRNTFAAFSASENRKKDTGRSPSLVGERANNASIALEKQKVVGVLLVIRYRVYNAHTFPPPWKLVSPRCILSRCNGPCKPRYFFDSATQVTKLKRREID